MHRSFSRLVPVAAAAVLATGCSAGQVAQTASQVPSVDGLAVDVGDIALRDITLELPSGGFYEAGDDARVLFVAVNENALEADRLLSVSSEAFGGGTDESASDLPVELPPNTDVGFREDGPVVELIGVNELLRSSASVPVTFTFEEAGEVTVMVPVATPLEYIENEAEPFDFHGEEE